MKRASRFSLLPAAIALFAGFALADAPAQAQLKCYDSYVTLSGTCPDSCGRGADCPCVTCQNQDQSRM